MIDDERLDLMGKEKPFVLLTVATEPFMEISFTVAYQKKKDAQRSSMCCLEGCESFCYV